MEDRIEKIINKLNEISKYYEVCANKIAENGNPKGAEVYHSKANAFMRAGWIVEVIWNGDEISEYRD